MNIKITPQSHKDLPKIMEAVKLAFESATHTDGDEYNLVKRLSCHPCFVEELALVAKINDTIVGHCMFTRVEIISGNKTFPSLALAPVAVIPTYQGKGVGTALISQGLVRAKELGFSSVIVLGSQMYYPKFGFKPASEYEITAPFEVPSQNFMALELTEGSLQGVSGRVLYSQPFGI